MKEAGSNGGDAGPTVREGGRRVPLQDIERVTIRFAGDSGDGMQLTGTQFTNTAALIGNDIATLPDYPAEIRAPAGSLPGVSGFQVSFASSLIHTPGDEPDVLVAMNPAALKVNLRDLPEGGTLIVNTDAFVTANLKKAGYDSNPLEDGSLKAYRVHAVPLSANTAKALAETSLPRKQVERCKNFYALGLMYWLYNRPLDATLRWIEDKFAKNQDVAGANTLALKAGYNFGETTEIFTQHYVVRPAALPTGRYRNVTGNEATAMGFVTAARLANKPLFYGSYPITPASDILHELSRLKRFNVRTFQAEDEIAAVGATIGAAFGGALALTGTSGPGLALKAEAIGLAVMTELPLVVVNVQRAGPSTGMPTKTEQADLFQAMYGRNGESPVVVLAPRSPADCFDMAVEAMRIAVKYMVPVIYLSDGYLANGSEPWRIPDVADLPAITVHHPSLDSGYPDGSAIDPADYLPYRRDEATLARPWAIPGTPHLEHRIGGLEKNALRGNVDYDPQNHQRMTDLRQAKVDGVAKDIPPLEVNGEPKGKLLLLGWGGTYGAITSAVDRMRSQGKSVSSAHLRYLNPFPANFDEVIASFEKILVPELNGGQLCHLVRARTLRDAVSLAKVQGKPFKVSEIIRKAEELL